LKHQKLLLVALPGELPESMAPRNFKLTYTGVGKINAAVATLTAINEFKPEAILNFGTAGALKPTAAGICVVKSVIQRDMLAEPLSPRGVTPFDQNSTIFQSNIGNYNCATGDSFVTKTDPWLIEKNVDLVDMELFGIAHVCSKLDIPWYSFKFVTDFADETSGHDWETNTKVAAKEFLEFIKDFSF